MREERLSSLRHAARGRVVLKYLGQLALMLALLTVVPLAVALIYAEHGMAWRYGAVLALLLAFGAPLARWPAPDRIQANEALAVTTLAFVLAPALMSLPMAGAGLSWTDALFEAVSGVTTTGLTTLASVEDKPHAFLFARAWMQWYGGLGIAVLCVALLMGHADAARRLLEPVAGEGMVTATRIHARRVLAVYAGLTVLGAGALLALGVAPFHALTHALAGVSTGGFSSLDAGLGGLGSLPAAAAAGLLGLVGAVSLPAYYYAVRQGPRELTGDAEFRALLLFVAALGGLLALALMRQPGYAAAEAVSQGLLLGLSAQTTTGFSTLDVQGLDGLTKGLLMAGMFTGGSVGSTAGGVKLLNLLILLRLLQLSIQRTALPGHAVVEMHLAGRRVSDDLIARALLLIALFGALIGLSWLAFLAYGYDPLDALFEVVSAAGTVGLSSGVSRSGLPDFLKLVLCIDMIAGRVEIIALLVTCHPGTWWGRKAALR